MSTERVDGTFAFHCNGCSECRVPDEEERDMSFTNIWPRAQADGWVAFRTGDPNAPWGHYCPSCAEK